MKQLMLQCHHNMMQHLKLHYQLLKSLQLIPPTTPSISTPSASSTTTTNTTTSKSSSHHLPKSTPAFHLPKTHRRPLRQTKLTERRKTRSTGSNPQVPQSTGSNPQVPHSTGSEEPPPPPHDSSPPPQPPPVIQDQALPPANQDQPSPSLEDHLDTLAGAATAIASAWRPLLSRRTSALLQDAQHHLPADTDRASR